jgi:hypothetical protein
VLLGGRVMFSDWSVDVDQAEGEPAGRNDTQAVEVPTDRHLDLYDLLMAASRQDRAGRRVCWWPQAKLAAKLGISVRTLQGLLADLREPGGDPRHRRGQPAGLRLGLLMVTPTMRKDPATGGRLYAGNLYVLTPGRHATRKAAPTSSDAGGVACLNKETPASEGRRVSNPGVSSSLTVVDVGHQRPLDQLDYDPTPSEVVATLERAFGAVTVLQWPEGYKRPPRRVRLSGYPKRPRVPAGAVSVAYPSRWRNPYRPRKRTPEANAKAVEQYRQHLRRRPRLRTAAVEELAGQDLACWCPPDLPCHADVLLEIANPSPRRNRARG